LRTDLTPRLREFTGVRRATAVALMACGLLAAIAFPATAAAKQSLMTGFSDPDEYQTTDSATRNLWFGRTADSGAGIVRLAIEWPTIVGATRPADPTNPADPSYDFSSVDGAVRDAKARGLKVLLTINHAPVWAEGAGRPADAAPGTWKPNPQDLADFSRAVAARYTGNFDPDGVGTQPSLPAVDYVEIWDEPNSSDWITPQFDGKNALSPDYYRTMLNTSYKAVKAVNPQMQVVTGGTDPYGDPPGGPYPPGSQRVRPVSFWEQLLCVRPVKGKKGKGKKGKASTPTKFVRTSGCSDRAMFDIFAHHPIDNTGGGPLQSGPNKDDASTPDLGRVVAVLRAAEKAGTTLPGKHPVWVTEFWWDSKPPNTVGAPLATQARWVEQSMYLFWKAGASVAINFQIADATARANVHAGLQSGVYFTDGRAKPSLTAFRFPFVTDRINTKKLTAWGKAPEAGSLSIQRKQGGRWVTIKRLQVGKGSVFSTNLSLPGKQQLRAMVGASQSLVWKQSATVQRPHAAAAGGGGGGGGPSTRTIALLLGGGAVLVLGGAARLRRRQVLRNRRMRALA
jgi:hypothetical protein